MTQYKTAFLYVCDVNYHDMTQYSICSLMRAAGRPLSVHFFQYDYDQPCERLAALAAELGHSLHIEPLPVNLVSEGFEEEAGDGRHAHVTGTAFIKPFAVNRLAQTYDYVVYLDSDVLFLGPVDWPLFEGFDEIAAGVLDFAHFARADFHDHCAGQGLAPDYINSGVVAFNAGKWKETGFLRRYRENSARHLEGCNYFEGCVLRDQCPINMTIGGDVRILPLDMNVQQWAIGTRYWAEASIRHYVGARKFLSPRLHNHDERERQLLQGLEADLELGQISLPIQDFGLAQAMNKLRRGPVISRRAVMLAGYPDCAGAELLAG